MPSSAEDDTAFSRKLDNPKKTALSDPNKTKEDGYDTDLETEVIVRKPYRDGRKGVRTMVTLNASSPNWREQITNGYGDLCITDDSLEGAKTFDSSSSGKNLYLSVCKALGIVPAKYFIRHMTDPVLAMQHHGLGALGVKGMCIPLQNNACVTSLNLEDNWLEDEGAVFIATMLKENCYVVDLNLANNKIGTKGAIAICSVLSGNAYVDEVNLAGNSFTDNDLCHFTEMINENHRLRALNLSHNQLGGPSSKAFGLAIGDNEALEELDLSWNQFRGSSAVQLCDGIKMNLRLRSVNLSFNGFGNGGAVGVAEILKQNHVLQELDISYNRILPTGAALIGKALEVNDALVELRIGNNEIGPDGAKAILKGISGDSNVIKCLDMSAVDVDKEFVATEKEIVENKVKIKRAYVMGDYIIKGPPKKKGKLFGITMDEITPTNFMEFLLNYAQEVGSDFVENLWNAGSEKNDRVHRQDFLNIIQDSGIELNQEQASFVENALYKMSNSAGLVDVSKYI